MVVLPRRRAFLPFSLAPFRVHRKSAFAAEFAPLLLGHLLEAGEAAATSHFADGEFRHCCWVRYFF
jgi:hypothetical protein